MRYYYFLSYKYNDSKGIIYQNTVIDTKKKIKDSEGVKRLIQCLKEKENVSSIHISCLTLLHKKWFG